MPKSHRQTIDGLFTEIELVAEQLDSARNRLWTLIEETRREQGLLNDEDDDGDEK